MELDAVKLDAPIINNEHWANYWREKAECLEEWVCVLLRKNQELRMNLGKEETIQGRYEGVTATFSLRRIYQPTLSSAQSDFRTESPQFSLEADPESCPSKACAEIRESVIQKCRDESAFPDGSKLKG